MFTAANKGSYVAQAGQANPFLDAFSVASAYSFDAFDLAKAGMQADAAKYITKKENEAKRDYYKTMGETNLAGQEQVNKAADYAAQQQRMAGGLGLLGALSYGTSRYFQNKNNQLPPPEKRQSADNSAHLEALSSQVESLQDSLSDITKFGEKYGTLKNTKPNETSATGGVTPSPSPSVSTPTKASPSGGNGWSKLSKVIRFGEGTTGDKGYTTQFTGSQFTDLSKHPRQIKSGGGYKSDAAGAYQFLSTTWDEAKEALKLQDFSPASQEAAGKFLAQRRGVDPNKVYTTIEEFKEAMDKLAPEWASLPYSKVSPGGFGSGSSYYGQGGISLQKAWELYNS